MRVAVYALTDRGADLGRRLACKLGADCFILHRYAADGDTPFKSLTDLVADTFSAYEGHVFIAASGIVVRMIAPHLKNKAEDPAVVVLDQGGKFAVSLVSGHLGGANELARLVGDKIGSAPVITTATDCAGVPSIDLLARKAGLVIGDIGLIKHVNSALLDGEKVPFYDPDSFLNISDLGDFFYPVESVDILSESRCGIMVGWQNDEKAETVLPLYPRCLTLGIGCRRGVPAGEILELVHTMLDRNRIALESVSCIGSIEAKKDEQGLIEAADILGLELKFYTAAELDEIDIANPSGVVMKHMGVGGVCEAAAMKMANAKEILIPKTKSARVTAALAKVVSK